MANTRFSPSPTGMLHIGGVRTAMYAYALAKKTGGTFYVRIEDTDQKRKVDGSEQEIYEMLSAYGITWDETFRQSDRLDIYKKYALELVEKGAAYYCFTPLEEIAEARRIAQENKEQFKFRSKYRDLSISEAKELVEQGKKYVIRQKMPENQEVEFEDAVQGKMKFNTNDSDDTVLLKSDGFPTYHLAVVVDDHLTQITHVFRGVEWIPSIPKHVLLYQAFGWEIPRMAHLSVILDPDHKGKLSKRRGSVSAKGFLAEGYLPEAMNNFLMLLGWSSPVAREHGEKEREIYTLNDFVELFDIKDLNKSNPVFNRQKLLWFNQQYLHNLSPDELVNKFSAWLKDFGQQEKLQKQIVDKGPDFLQEALKLIQTRVSLLAEIPEHLEIFYEPGNKVDWSEIKQLQKTEAKTLEKILKEFVLFLEKEPDLVNWGHDLWEERMRKIAENFEVKAGVAFMALRIAVTDSAVSPPLYETMVILGSQEVLNRIKRYVQ